MISIANNFTLLPLLTAEEHMATFRGAPYQNRIISAAVVALLMCLCVVLASSAGMNWNSATGLTMDVAAVATATGYRQLLLLQKLQQHQTAEHEPTAGTHPQVSSPAVSTPDVPMSARSSQYTR
jgi:hypothetical protein